MLRKLTVSLLFVSLLLSQAMVTTSQSSADNEAIDLAAMLPDSDLAVTMDFNRGINVAAPSILGMDPKKIEHLNELLKTIENQIGINPREVRQIAAGFNIPPNIEDKDFIAKLNPTVILKTQNSNANLIDTWSKKIDAIIEFSMEKEPTRRYMNSFREFRDFKAEYATPEKISAAIQKVNESLKKSAELEQAINAVPKLNTDAATINRVGAANKDIAASLNRYQSILKSDTDLKNYREMSIRLLNRWNGIAVDDVQRKQKLDAILQESKSIYQPYRKKFNNAKMVDAMMNPEAGFVAADELQKVDASADSSTVVGTMDSSLTMHANRILDTATAALGKLSPARLKRTEQLSDISQSLNEFDEVVNNTLDMVKPNAEAEAAAEAAMNEPPPIVKKDDKSLSELIKASEIESTVNNKRLLIFSLKKLSEIMPKDASSEQKPAADPNYDLRVAVGFIDDRTMVFGMENSVTEVLKRDANYKNAKVLQMLGGTKNALIAFAAKSSVFSSITDAFDKNQTKSAETSKKPDSYIDSFMKRAVKNISVYGSINFDPEGASTNDITMSLGMIRDVVEKIDVPQTNSADADDTFDFGGYLVSKEIFFDLLNSFKAVQASMTFKFEKQKVAKLARNAPKIIDTIIALKSSPKTGAVKTKPGKIETVQDIVTTPQVYIDVAKFLSNRGS